MEYEVLNPRRRRRSRKARARKHGAKRRHRSATITIRNPRRRHRRSHRMHNPRAMRFFGIDVGEGLLIGAGAIGTGVVTNLAAGFIPVPQLTTGPGRMLLKAAVPVTLGLIGRRNRMLQLLAMGGVVSIVIDAYKMVQAQVPALPGVGDYSEVLQDYVPEVSGIGAVTHPMAAVYGSPF